MQQMRNKSAQVSPSMRRAIGLVVSAILVTLGILFLVPASHAWFKASKSTHWTPIDAVLVEDQHHFAPHVGYRTLKYSYEFGDRFYVSDRVCFGMDSMAIDRVQTPSIGGTLRAFINPSLPSESVLVQGNCGGAWIFVAVGFGLSLLGLLVAILAIKGAPRT